MVYIYICACLLRHFFTKFGIAIGGGVSSEMKEPKLHKLGVFWANYCKKHPIWSKFENLVLFFRKWYTDGWEISLVKKKSDFRHPAGTSTYEFDGSNPPPRVLVPNPQIESQFFKPLYLGPKISPLSLYFFVPDRSLSPLLLPFWPHTYTKMKVEYPHPRVGLL